MHEPFVAAHEIELNQGMSLSNLRFFFTTKKLLESALLVNHMATDATYKLNWQDN